MSSAGAGAGDAAGEAAAGLLVLTAAVWVRASAGCSECCCRITGSPPRRWRVRGVKGHRARGVEEVVVGCRQPDGGAHAETAHGAY